jgi:phosphoglycerate dehydrogenase-like enzyme
VSDQLTLLLAGNNTIANAERIVANLDRPWKVLKWYPDRDEREALLAMLPRADVLVGGDVLGGWPAGLKLGMYQIPYTGCDWAGAARLPARCRFCNTFEHESAIAEYVLLNLLEWEIGMGAEDRDFRDRGWDVGWPSRDGHGEIRGKTVGIVGYGHIGREVAARCAPFGTRVIGVARGSRATPPELDWLGVCEGADSPDLHRLYEQSDYVVVCCLLSEQTRGMINADGFARMRGNAVIINVARGAVIEEQALYNALRDKTIRGASIDVWYDYPEPGKPKPEPSRLPMFELDNIRVSPHSSGSTKETTERRWVSVIDNLNRFARGEELCNVVFTGTGTSL